MINMQLVPRLARELWVRKGNKRLNSLASSLLVNAPVDTTRRLLVEMMRPVRVQLSPEGVRACLGLSDSSAASDLPNQPSASWLRAMAMCKYVVCILRHSVPFIMRGA